MASIICVFFPTVEEDTAAPSPNSTLVYGALSQGQRLDYVLQVRASDDISPFGFGFPFYILYHLVNFPV